MAETDDEIDKLKLPAAVRLAKERSISISGLRDLEEIKCELKKKLLSGCRKRDDVIQDLMVAADEDSRIRHELIKIYQKTVESLGNQSHNDHLIRSVSKCYKKTNVIDMLKKLKGKLDGKISRCPVLVLGDTGAGKSSFINLLLGQQVFPCSLLSNTSVICEISYCDIPSARLYPHDDEDDSVTMEIIQAKEMDKFDFEKLSNLVQQRDETKNRSRFQKAEISFPLPILKTGLIIVDSPGVGDTPEMTKLVLDYLMEASAFVFIINTIDGVQISRLEMLLEQLVKRVMTGDKYYKPDCTMFICNKWDQVPIDERTSVYDDAVKKLRKIWIGFKPSQLYTLSTKEALWIQKDGLIVGRFEKILQGIISLLPPSRQQLLAMSTGKLYEFLTNCMTCIGNNLHQIKMTPEEAQRETLMVSNHMKVLRSEVSDFFDQQKSGLKSNLSRLADDLSKHLRTAEVRKDLRNFDSSDPELAGKNFQDVAIVIRSRVYDGISKHMRLWEDKEKHLEGIGRQLMDRFKEKFPDFDAQLFQVERLFRNTWGGDQNDSEEKVPLVPNVISNRFSSLNLGIKVILGVALSPVFLIGVIVRLPYWGLRQLGTMFKNEMLTRNFVNGDEKEKNQVIDQYRDNVISRMTEKSVIDSCLGSQLSVLYQYIDNQKEKVIEQIDGKLDMLNTSGQDVTPQQNMAWVNSQMTVDVLLKNLEYFNMMFLPQNLNFKSPDDFDITETLTNGIMAKIVLAKNKKTGEMLAIRQNNTAVVMDRIKQFQKEEKYYRVERKPHIITVSMFIKKDMEIWQCFRPPRQTLQKFIKQKNYKEYDDTKLEFYYNVLNQVALGLSYLQQKGLVHIDLCQDTVMVDEHDKVTLVNISYPNLLDETKFSMDITNVAGYVHFSVDIISSPHMTVYEMKHDMYSLGILMWELWSQKPAFHSQITESNIKDLKMFCEFLKTVDIKSLLPPLQHDDNITSLRNIWHSIIVQSLQTGNDLTARKWIDNFVHDSRPRSEVEHLYRRGDRNWDSATIYSRIH